MMTTKQIREIAIREIAKAIKSKYKETRPVEKLEQYIHISSLSIEYGFNKNGEVIDLYRYPVGNDDVELSKYKASYTMHGMPLLQVIVDYKEEEYTEHEFKLSFFTSNGLELVRM